MPFSTEPQHTVNRTQQVSNEGTAVPEDALSVFDGLTELEQLKIQRKINWVLLIRDARNCGDEASLL